MSDHKAELVVAKRSVFMRAGCKEPAALEVVVQPHGKNLLVGRL